MDDPSPIPGTEDAGRGDSRRPPGTPRWVKVFGIIAAVVVLLFLVLLVTGNKHSPGRHLGGDQRAPGIEHTTPHP